VVVLGVGWAADAVGEVVGGAGQRGGVVRELLGDRPEV
jgi:hypothetical protein